MELEPLLTIGLAGLAVIDQNVSLDVAEKGFPIAIYNRT
jgi:6-phosphogluconate dehydrogenase